MRGAARCPDEGPGVPAGLSLLLGALGMHTDPLTPPFRHWKGEHEEGAGRRHEDRACLTWAGSGSRVDHGVKQVQAQNGLGIAAARSADTSLLPPSAINSGVFPLPLYSQYE